MSGTREDYRSYLLRLYQARKGEESNWQACLHSPQGGQPLHFADLGELVALLEQEDDPGKSVDEQGQDCP